MLKTILQNLLSYDFLIISLALFNGLYVMPKATHYSNLLRNQLQTKVYLPILVLLEHFHNPASSSINLHQLKSLQDKELKLYGLFSTINGLFPLLGMLGTILSLLRIVSLDSQSVIMNFTTALTSTFWGLLFAIFFKAIDGYLNHFVQQNTENLTLLVDRMDRYYVGEDVDAKSKMD